MSKQLGIIGVGTIGSCLARLFKLNKQYILQGTIAEKHLCQKLSQELGFKIHTDNQQIVRQCSTIFLATKPPQIKSVCQEIYSELRPQQTIISVAAGLGLTHLTNWLPPCRIVLAMPNLPLFTGQSSIALCSQLNESNFRGEIESLFSNNQSVWLPDENSMHLATTVSGCAPAYIAYIAKVMIKLAQQRGLDSEQAQHLIQPVFQATSQIMSQMTLSEIIDKTACKGGATEQAMKVLQTGQLDLLINQVYDISLNRIREINQKIK